MDSKRIALDVMGGDAAPEATLRGALRVCSDAQAAPLPPERLVLVGDEARIHAGLEEQRERSLKLHGPLPAAIEAGASAPPAEEGTES